MVFFQRTSGGSVRNVPHNEMWNLVHKKPVIRDFFSSFFFPEKNGGE